MKYTCPHCNTNWTLGESHYRGGQVFACDCNQKSVIPLYCPVCNPATQQLKSWLTTPSGDLGGKLFRCPSGHTFTPQVDSETAHTRLQKLGTEIGQYHQGSRIATLSDSGTRTAVSGGYCSGACYDWIRRVLVSATPKLSFFIVVDLLASMQPF